MQTKKDASYQMANGKSHNQIKVYKTDEKALMHRNFYEHIGSSTCHNGWSHGEDGTAASQVESLECIWS